MRAHFSALLALFLVCSPLASAQIATPQIGYHDMNGSWRLEGVFLGTLTLTRNANGVVRGTYASPVLQNNSTCRGDSNGPGFLITCTQAGQPHVVISAAMLAPTLTRPNTPPPPRMRGYMYVVALSASQASEPPTMVSFAGRHT
jgi:hypothetical protein